MTSIKDTEGVGILVTFNCFKFYILVTDGLLQETQSAYPFMGYLWIDVRECWPLFVCY